MQIRHIEPADRVALEEFLQRIPDADRTFLKEDVADPDVVAAWARPGDARSIALDDDGVVLGYVAVIPLHGWSSHVGEVRIVVDPARRGHGVGRQLLDATLAALAERGAPRVVLSTAEQNEPAQRLFASAGFRPTMIEMTRELGTRDA